MSESCRGLFFVSALALIIVAQVWPPLMPLVSFIALGAVLALYAIRGDE